MDIKMNGVKRSLYLIFMIHRPVDTYCIIKNLQSSGFTEPQAKAILDSIYENDHHEHYATQTQMQEVKHEINALRIDIQCIHTQLSVIEHKLVYKLGGILISGVAILGILDRYFA